MKPGQPFANLPALAAQLRGELENKKTILLYAYNGTGKTRLSMAFKDAGKKTIQRPLSVGDHVGQPLTITESHGNYSLFEPQQMLDENKAYFRKILHDFLNRYPFNPELFPAATEEVTA